MSKQVSFVKNLSGSVKEVKPVTFGEIEFNVKNYLSILEKLTIIELCIDNAIDEETKKFNSALLEMVFDYNLAKFYTNLNLSDNVAKMYDTLKASGLMDFIKENIPESEINFLTEHIENRLEEEFEAIERENTFVNVIKKFLEEINNSVPEMLDELKNFDTEKLQMLKGILDPEKGGLDNTDKKKVN